MANWRVYWDNARYPNGRGKVYTRYGDAIKFAVKQRNKESTRLCEIQYEGPHSEYTFTYTPTKEKFVFHNDQYIDIYELPKWLTE
mgnify:CR=1 FL=1